MAATTRIWSAAGWRRAASAGTSITGSTPCPSHPALRERRRSAAAHRPLLPQHWGLLHLARAGAAPAGPPVRGNIRELRNVVEYFSYLGHTVVGVEELPHLPLPPRRRAPAELPALADCPRRTPASCWSGSRGRPGGPQPGREAILAAAREYGAPLLPAGGAARHPGRAGPGGPGAGEPRPGRHPPHPGRAGPVPPAGGGGRSEWFDQFDRFSFLTSLNAPCLLHFSAGWSWTARRVSFCYA